MNNTILEILFCIIYVIIFIFIYIKTITGGVKYSNFWYKLLFISILIFSPIYYYYYYGDINNINLLNFSNIFNIIKTILSFIFFIGLLYGIIYLMGNFTFFVYIISVIIGILIIMFAFSILNEIFKNTNILNENNDDIKKNSVLNILWNLIFYIPCLITDFIEYIKEQIDITPNTIFILLFFELILLLLYFYLPDFINKLIIHDGTQIIKDPLYLNDRQDIASISSIFPKLEINKMTKNDTYTSSQLSNEEISSVITGTGTATDRYGTQTTVNCLDVFMKSGAGYIEISGCNLEIYDPTYSKGMTDNEIEIENSNSLISNVLRTYSISTWVFINPQPSSVNSYSVPTNILRIGPYNIETATQRTQGKPMLSYFNYRDVKNGITKGTYRIYLSNTDKKYYDITAPEQKWNSFIFNYSNKIDVFLNGELVISASNIIPPTFSNTDSFVVGDDGGLDGSIKNTIFFPHILTTQQIYNIGNYKNTLY